MLVSVVIPCRNEEDYIESCIRSVFQSTYSSLEVIVVDGKSTDQTISILNQLKSEFPELKLVVNEKQTTPFALNLGIKASNGEIIIILGAHSELSSNYVQGCVEQLSKQKELGCVGGVLENVCLDELTRVISLGMGSGFGVGNAYFRTGSSSGYVDTVAFGAYPRFVFDQIGFFDEDLTRNQDDEFNFRLLKNGYKIWLSKDFSVRYYVRSNWEKLRKQYFQYGYWKVFVNRKHQTITTIRQLIPFFFVCFLLSGIACLLIPGYWIFYLFVLLSYLISACYFAYQQSSKLGSLVPLIYTFLILHLSYGWGYFRGIIDFYLLNISKPGQSGLTR
ncbi:MAG: glycosyltransferase family 2 protein [Bacteroidia bacterium]|nr:glycosyltransferase family 2 protein [Bacteroidia bacterium]